MDKLLAGLSRPLDAVIELKVDEGVLLSRIESRIRDNPGAVRADDNAETLKRRLAVYRQQTAPVADYYRQKGHLEAVDGMASKDQVAAAIARTLKAKARPERVR